ncbi:MAG: hypothetical protein WD768_07885 [Phycisphaeraceae bacterium]
MSRTAQFRFTGGAFLAAALMWWLGSMLLPVKIGTYFEAEVFAPIHEQFRLWIWIYRVQIFGMITALIAFIALASFASESAAKVMIWPGAAVIAAGLIVGALGEAFYYHHGAWGAKELAGKSPEEMKAFVQALKVDTEYVTCLVRFGRVFSGLGLVVLAWGLWLGGALPRVLVGAAALIGFAAMALTMGLPDNDAVYMPVYHAFMLWLAVTGVVIVRGGIKFADAASR